MPEKNFKKKNLKISETNRCAIRSQKYLFTFKFFFFLFILFKFSFIYSVLHCVNNKEEKSILRKTEI